MGLRTLLCGFWDSVPQVDSHPAVGLCFVKSDAGPCRTTRVRCCGGGGGHVPSGRVDAPCRMPDARCCGGGGSKLTGCCVVPPVPDAASVVWPVLVERGRAQEGPVRGCA